LIRSVLLIAAGFIVGVSFHSYGIFSVDMGTRIDAMTSGGAAIIATTTTTTTNYTTTISTSTQSLFDKMHHRLYEMANAPQPVNKSVYKIGDVRNTGGGLTNADRQLLSSLYYNASSIFEFGLGESTHIAAFIGVSRYAGVDSDAAWVGKARDGARKDHFRYSFADIGDTAGYGNPRNNRLQKIPLEYQSEPLNAELEPFDVYLVDGRYRVSCACASFLHAMSRGGDMAKVTVVIHDWEREHYHAPLKIANILETSEKSGGKLAALRLKPEATEEEIFELWEEYMWDQR